MNLEREYNSGTSVRHLEQMKMYAELTRNKKCEKLEIKNFNGNKLQISASLCIEERTLRKHKKVDKESYISLIGNQLDRISRKMHRYVDRGYLLDGAVDEVTSNVNAIDGNPARSLPPGDSIVPGSLFVKCPKSFYRGDKFEIVSDTIPTPLTVYVTSVNSSDSYIVLQTNPVDESAAVPAALAGYLLEDNVKLLPCGFTEQKNCGELLAA